MDTPSILALVPFLLDETRFALSLDTVERVERAVETTPLPGAPPIVSGVINVHGTVVPVVNLRVRFGLADRRLHASNHLILSRTRTRRVGVVVDRVFRPVNIARSAVASGVEGVPANKYVTGVAVLEDGLVFIHDLDTVLSLDEEQTLQEALDRASEIDAHPDA